MAFSRSTTTARRGRERGRKKAIKAALPHAPRCHSSGSSGASTRIDPMARAGAGKDARKANRRGAARLGAVQALYQMEIAGTGLNEILAEFEKHWIGRELEGAQYLPAEAAFFRDIVSGVLREQRSLDPLIDDTLARGWPLKRIDAVLRA